MIESNFPSIPSISQIGAAAASHGTHVTYSTTAPVMDGSATAGTAATVARSDHRHPVDTSRAATSHNHSATNITSGTLAVARGGTGQTSVQALRNSMGLGNTTGAVPIANGGTGATTAAAGRGALGAVANYIVSITIPNSGWSGDTGGGYYRDITVANMTATAPAKLDFAMTTDKAAGELMVSEFLANILRIEQMAGKVRVHTYASGKAPSVNIPVRLSWTA